MKTVLKLKSFVLPLASIVCAAGLATWALAKNPNPNHKDGYENSRPVVSKEPVIINGAQMIIQGRNIFRFDTFGDEAFWGQQICYGARFVHEA